MKFINILAEMLGYEKSMGRDIAKITMSKGYYELVFSELFPYFVRPVEYGKQSLLATSVLGIPLDIIDPDMDMWYVVEIK